MTAAGALILYPSWAIAVLLVATAVRLGRATGRGLLAVSSLLAMWIALVLLVELPATRGLAEHLIPFGMMQAGGYVHATLELTGQRARRGWLAWLAYAWGVAIGVLGAAWPRGLYGADLVGAGPAFWPIAGLSALGALAVSGWMLAGTLVLRFRASVAPSAPARRQMTMLAVGNLLSIAAGGGAVLLRVVGWVHELHYTAPASLVGVLVIGAAVVRGEEAAARRMIVQTFAYAVMAAVITAAGLTALIAALPVLTPGPAIAWTALVVLCAAIPLDALRAVIVDGLGRRLFAAPIGVRDLAEQAERHEVRADHAARLAELGALVGAVAHEVRNPLGVISAHVKLLERAGAPAHSLDAVRAQVRRASRFVDDLLAYGKPRPLAPRELELAPVVDEAVAAVRAVHGAGAIIEVAIAPGTTALADRAALGDVLVNLIGNAVIAVGARGRVTITAAPDAGALAIAVTDDGPGVPRELADRLFQPFVTGRGRDHAHPGTGLGLATARSIAERHGGSLEHVPVAGGGARFVLRLPRA